MLIIPSIHMVILLNSKLCNLATQFSGVHKYEKSELVEISTNGKIKLIIIDIYLYMFYIIWSNTALSGLIQTNMSRMLPITCII